MGSKVVDALDSKIAFEVAQDLAREICCYLKSFYRYDQVSSTKECSLVLVANVCVTDATITYFEAKVNQMLLTKTKEEDQHRVDDHQLCRRR